MRVWSLIQRGAYAVLALLSIVGWVRAVLSGSDLTTLWFAAFLVFTNEATQD